MSAELTLDVELAARKLASGGLVAFATETVYGLGGNALDVNAVASIFAAKRRPHFDPLIVHLADRDELDNVVAVIPDVAEELVAKFWPGPLTLVLPKKAIVPDLVTAGLPGVAVRVPDHALARELIRRSGVPVAAPSANPFGRISPTTAQHVLSQLGEEIDLVLDGGPCRIGVESTVLQIFEETSPVLLRYGGLTREMIEAEIGPVRLPVSSSDESGPQTSPGQLLKHYAPRKRLHLLDSWEQALPNSGTGAISFGPFPNQDQFGCVEILSESFDLTEATANFFAAMRRLDESPISQILAVYFPDHGLGRALNDRLRRASQ